MSITAAQAQKAIAAGLAKAKEVGSPSTIAILDSGRNLVALQRMEGAPLASIEISQGKAYTSASLMMNTADLTQYVQPGAPFYGLEVSHRHTMVVFGGGVVAKKGEAIIGAVGVAGGMLDNDIAIANAVSTAL
jgi:uncharacterized protein GlcG (DUF336 family)